jgi:hypothetical protein
MRYGNFISSSLTGPLVEHPWQATEMRTPELFVAEYTGWMSDAFELASPYVATICF